MRLLSIPVNPVLCLIRDCFIPCVGFKGGTTACSSSLRQCSQWQESCRYGRCLDIRPRAAVENVALIRCSTRTHFTCRYNNGPHTQCHSRNKKLHSLCEVKCTLKKHHHVYLSILLFTKLHKILSKFIFHSFVFSRKQTNRILFTWLF